MEPLDYREKRVLLVIAAVAVLMVGATAWRHQSTRMVFLPAAGAPVAFQGVQNVQAAEKSPGKPVSGKKSAAPAVKPVTWPVNINTAGSRELEALPGIGTKLAQAILGYRNEHGPFKAIEDLMKVKGIGPGRFGAIKDLVTAGEQKGQ